MRPNRLAITVVLVSSFIFSLSGCLRGKVDSEKKPTSKDTDLNGGEPNPIATPTPDPYPDETFTPEPDPALPTDQPVPDPNASNSPSPSFEPGPSGVGPSPLVSINPEDLSPFSPDGKAKVGFVVDKLGAFPRLVVKRARAEDKIAVGTKIVLEQVGGPLPSTIPSINPNPSQTPTPSIIPNPSISPGKTRVQVPEQTIRFDQGGCKFKIELGTAAAPQEVDCTVVP